MGAGLACAAALTFFASAACAQPVSPAQAGMAWQVQGEWRVDRRHATIRDGDAVEVGTLLRPVGSAPDHSIAILLPDSQRIFYECFSSQDCSRGFLVPRLMADPDPFAVEMMARVRAVLAKGSRGATAAASGMPRPIPRDEAILTLDSGNRAEIGGLAQSLPEGRYVCYAQRIDAGNSEPLRLAVEKSAPRLSLVLPQAGIYEIKIRDDRNVLRIDLFAAAETADRAQELGQHFSRAKALLRSWNEVFKGWPVHELLRAYLQGLVFNVNSSRIAEASASVTDGVHKMAHTAPPVFSPRPGYQGRDIAVSLQSTTEGATIHYMLGGAQPTATSPVYKAPIMVKASGLMIEAFASAPGMKDSPVVTGTFFVHTDSEH